MKRALALMVACFALSAPAAAQGQRDPDAGKTASYYRANPEERWTKLLRCMEDEAEARRPSCANARNGLRDAESAARERPRRRSFQARRQTPNEVLTDPRFYLANPMARWNTLARCERTAWRGEPGLDVADCRAALAAERMSMAWN